ncbi:Catechol 2,3-dioxygenase [Collimonas sp. OK307]|uniref:VOC family protein n=1 Tax=Collimonas sp. OK307 TaxID=1801620 RepID=UPI0008F0CE6B|nr:VOC family protein [Collimonas sp. OK307]SFI32406.1 Catechol 2,3-dioxygenase [Collimonas sp. OK307]
MSNNNSVAGSLRLYNLALAVGDLDNMINWYDTVLGFTVTERGSFDIVGADFAMLESNGLRLELVTRTNGVQQAVDRSNPPDHLNVLGWKALVLESDDLSKTTAFLVENKVEIVWADQQLTAERRSTMIRDPEGNLVNIFGPRQPKV